MKVNFLIPDYVQKVARMLTKEGFKAYLVGGALRDVVLDIVPDDYDLATDAQPEQMLKIFPKSVSTGARFGMVSALVPDEKGEIHDVQVTTFRSEENYVDGRWPSKVTFITDLDKDLGRRDFTVNAMALDLSEQSMDGENVVKEWEIYDPFGGEKDLSDKLIRAVGTPLERFREDGLRAYKACRLASQLQFEIERETFDAIKEAVPVAKQVSMERIRDEFVKMLQHSPKPSIGIELMRNTGLLEVFLPELMEGVGVEQLLFHADDVYHHSLNTCDVAPDRIKLAALLHDIGKPRKDMHNGHFYGHDVEGANMTEEIMKRMKFSNEEIKRTVALVRNHMFFYPYVHDGMTEEEAKKTEEKAWTDAAIRRFVSRVGEENIEDLFALRIADATANPKTAFNPEEISKLQERISEVRQKDVALKISDLKVTGDDLIEIGVPKGPKVGEILKQLLEKVLDDPLLNTKERLEEEAMKLLK
jgi:poly(A) polymerase/tRNA nucleotidyltransferase (CCA-adding enzyme)